MLRSMYSGISGMKNFQTKLDVIGNNIANVNTYGFKKGRTTFKDLVSQQISGASSSQPNRGGTNPIQVGLGSSLSSIDTIHTQGSLQTTGRQLDLGLSGDGFFIVQNRDSQYYTRSGNFYLDELGRLVTAEGSMVQGYSGNDKTQLSPITVDSSAFMPPEATTSAILKGNLDLKEAASTLNFKVKDSQGNNHDLSVKFTKMTTNEWSYDVVDTTGASVLNTNNNNPTKLVFNSNGELDGGNSSFVDIAFSPENGASDLAIAIDFDQVTQVNAANTVAVSEMDGNSEGYLESFNIGQTGEVVGVFSNGEVNILSQLALATFSNNGGLTKVGGNLFQASNNSGIPNIGLPGDGRGAITAGALEMSNVDLSEEFTEMISAQRGFQANTRIITTSDEILQELVNLKR
jgi:flagellar hook protein FlgE